MKTSRKFEVIKGCFAPLFFAVSQRQLGRECRGRQGRDVSREKVVSETLPRSKDEIQEIKPTSKETARRKGGSKKKSNRGGFVDGNFGKGLELSLGPG